jgi:hypothetical protein
VKIFMLIFVAIHDYLLDTHTREVEEENRREIRVDEP